MLVSVTECKMRHKVGFLDTYNDGYWKKSIFKKLIYPISESNISNFTYLCLKNSENLLVLKENLPRIRVDSRYIYGTLRRIPTPLTIMDNYLRLLLVKCLLSICQDFRVTLNLVSSYELIYNIYNSC